MAKGKFIDWITQEGIIKLEGYARDGYTDVEIAKVVGIAPATLYVWQNRFPEIKEALKRGKEVVDRLVEQALLKKALGYNARLKKTFKVKIKTFDDKGHVTREAEELTTGYDEQHVAPDTLAQIYWLNNRKPEVWRDKKNIALSGAVCTENPYAGLDTKDLKKLIEDDF